MIASGSIDSIQWIASFGDLLLGTSGSEYKATGTDGVITPSGVSIVAQSYWGSSGGLAPLIIGNSVMHVQRHGSRVRDLFYSLEKDGYAGNDLSIMAPHLFDGYSILQWAYQQTPSSTIWCVRNDGTLLALTYMKEHEIYGWSRHPTDGKVRSVSVLSGEDSDVLLLVVERQVNGVTRHFLEKLEAPFGQDTAIEEAFFVDCGITQRSETGLDVVTGLDHLEGREVSVLADGSPVEGCVGQGKSACPTRPRWCTLAWPTRPPWPLCPWRPTHRPVPPWASAGPTGAAPCASTAAWAANTARTGKPSTTSPSCPQRMARPVNLSPATWSSPPAAVRTPRPPYGWCRTGPCRGGSWPWWWIRPSARAFNT